MMATRLRSAKMQQKISRAHLSSQYPMVVLNFFFFFFKYVSKLDCSRLDVSGADVREKTALAWIVTFDVHFFSSFHSSSLGVASCVDISGCLTLLKVDSPSTPEDVKLGGLPFCWLENAFVEDIAEICNGSLCSTCGKRLLDCFIF